MLNESLNQFKLDSTRFQHAFNKLSTRFQHAFNTLSTRFQQAFNTLSTRFQHAFNKLSTTFTFSTMFKRTEHLVQQSVECKLKQMLKPFKRVLTTLSLQKYLVGGIGVS